MLYRFVDDQKAAGFPVERICEVAGVSRAAYYDWKAHRDGIPTIGELEEARLVKEIGDIHDDSDGTYGSPRVTVELRRRGWVVNHKRTERLMRIHNIVGYTPNKHRTTTISDSEHRIPDLVQRDFALDALDTTWCGDISYIRTWEGFLYLSFVEDLASRRILGLSMASHMRAELVGDAPHRSHRDPRRECRWRRVPQRQGYSIYVDPVRRALRPLPGGPVGGPHRGVLGQRPCRVVPGHPEERTRPPAGVPHPHRSPPCYPSLDRSLVQPPPAQLRARIPVADRMGEQLPSHHQNPGRITEVSGQKGELQCG